MRCRGQRHPKAKLSEHDIYIIREAARLGIPRLNIAEWFSVSPGWASAIINRLARTTGGGMKTKGFTIQPDVKKGVHQIFCRVNEEVWKQIIHLATQAHCSNSEVVRQMIMYCFRNNQKKGGHR